MHQPFRRRALAICMALLLLIPAVISEAAGKSPPAPASGPGDPCPKTAPLRSYIIHAIKVDIVYNKYGEHDPQGLMYVLRENRGKVLSAVAANPGKTVSLVQPLAIRSALGDCVEVTFVNELSHPASIHPTGLSHHVNSDGMAVGYNPDSTVPPGATQVYRWYPEKEGAYFFADGADLTHLTDNSAETHSGTRSHGLFGALIVEPAGSTWTDPRTGQPLLSGVQADIHPPGAPSFREIVPFYHDGAPIVFPDGSLPREITGEEAHLYTMNYRGDPMHARLREGCPDCADKSQFYSSWAHGDPGGGDLVFPVYVGDPVVFRIVGAQVEENHVHHLHVHRWKSEPLEPLSNTIDSQTVNPGATYTAPLVAGAGYAHGTVGDVLFHCHLFPHYFSGMWAIMRVLDRARPDLLPLPDRQAPPAPTADSPGFPGFIGGTAGRRAPQPPDPDLRPPTPLEVRALRALKPGAPNTDPCPTGAPVRQYEVAAIDLDYPLNAAGDRSPSGRLFVPLELERDVRNGVRRPEPLVLRANRGDCVQVTLENHLDPEDTPNDVGIHIHYVAFDVLGSDGTAVGYNYNEGIRPGERIRYRWYADEEGSVFLHDHQSGSAKRGVVGMLAVEPVGSTWLDPQTGMPLQTGTQAIIVDPNGPDFREFALLYADQVDAVDAHGRPIQPRSTPGGHGDHGVMTINYANAPMFRRTGTDPAYAFSSWVHGDPDTPLLEVYPGDPVKIRLIQGGFEEQHSFAMHGARWKQEPANRRSGDLAAQTIGTSEYYDFHVQVNPVGIPQRDYLYGSMAADDLWNGMWGLFRVWGIRNPNLRALPDRGYPDTWIFNLGRQTRLRQTGTPPPMTPRPGAPCPMASPIRRYSVVALSREIAYNRYGDQDPHGILFTLAEDAQAVRSGAKPAEPLVIRANAGDCIMVKLTNQLPHLMSAHTDHAQVPADGPWPNSNRISLHPQLVQYDVQGSDGATVGFNYDQTVGPGQSITYTWYADRELGTTVLWDMADIRSHRHHGAYGLLIIEPKGAIYRDPVTGKELKSGAVADIIVPGGRSFREFALTFADGMYVVNANGSCVIQELHADVFPAMVMPCNQSGDAEDQGFKSINYRSAPFSRRLAEDPRKHLLFSSYVHDDPDTPLLRAYVGDPVRIRVADTGDKPRGFSFHLSGHLWAHQWNNPQSHYEGVRGSMTPGSSVDIVLYGGAGGPRRMAGDWLYQEQKQVGYLESGLWGIFRVLEHRVPDLLPLP